jgi:hypothetical protein
MPTIHYQHDDEQLCRSYLANVTYSRDDKGEIRVQSVAVQSVQLWCPGKPETRVYVDTRSREWEFFRITASWTLLEALRNDEAFSKAATTPGVLLMDAKPARDDGYTRNMKSRDMIDATGRDCR